MFTFLMLISFYLFFYLFFLILYILLTVGVIAFKVLPTLMNVDVDVDERKMEDFFQ